MKVVKGQNEDPSPLSDCKGPSYGVSFKTYTKTVNVFDVYFKQEIQSHHNTCPFGAILNNKTRLKPTQV